MPSFSSFASLSLSLSLSLSPIFTKLKNSKRIKFEMESDGSDDIPLTYSKREPSRLKLKYVHLLDTDTFYYYDNSPSNSKCNFGERKKKFHFLAFLRKNFEEGIAAKDWEVYVSLAFSLLESRDKRTGNPVWKRWNDVLSSNCTMAMWKWVRDIAGRDEKWGKRLGLPW